ncbi:MAG: hypothetical protein JRN21_07305 [Nitrososphaerota archaeon]|nr:hypothetical protein [Nitrososphaerota archaeon]
MTEEEDVDKTRRRVFAKFLPHLAVTAIGVGVFSSPVRLLSSAVERYNKATEETTKRLNDLLPLLPWLESLQLNVEGPRTVSLVISKEDMGSSVEQYLIRRFKNDGADGAMFGEPPGSREKAEFEYALRLPTKNVYAKVSRTFTVPDRERYLEIARRLNPSEVWLFVNSGEDVDEPMDPVFVGENAVLRGRLKSVTTAEMLSEFFGKEFDVVVEPQDDGSDRVVLHMKTHQARNELTA